MQRKPKSFRFSTFLRYGENRGLRTINYSPAWALLSDMENNAIMRGTDGFYRPLSWLPIYRYELAQRADHCKEDIITTHESRGTIFCGSRLIENTESTHTIGKRHLSLASTVCWCSTCSGRDLSDQWHTQRKEVAS